MRKTAIVLMVLLANLTACGADSNTTAAKEAAATTMDKAGQAAAAVVENAASTTVISPEGAAAKKAMSHEMGIDDFDAARIAREGESKFKAGVDYIELTPAQPTSSAPDAVEVAEVFMYGCPHCYSLEPFMKEYLKRKPVGVNFIRIPAQFNKPAELHAAAYYAGEALGVGEQVHLPIFQAIHGKRNPLNSQKAIKEIFVANGVDGADFDRSFSSFDVETKVRQARNLGMRYKITSVPTIIINGKYQANGTMSKSYDRFAEIIDFLVAKELVRDR